MGNQGNFLRRTAWTMIQDELKKAEEKTSMTAGWEGDFWRHNRDTLRWVVKILRERRLGKVR